MYFSFIGKRIIKKEKCDRIFFATWQKKLNLYIIDFHNLYFELYAIVGVPKRSGYFSKDSK
jgi:hypothetical protein